MAFMKLNADAPPFHPTKLSTRLHLRTPPPPRSVTAPYAPYHAGAACRFPEYDDHRYPLPPPPLFLSEGGFRWPRPRLPLPPPPPFLCDGKQQQGRPSPPPRALVFSRGAFVVEKLYRKALAKARALPDAATRRRRGPAAAQPCGLRMHQQAVARAWAWAWPARSPALTMRPASPPTTLRTPLPEWLGWVSTVMIRNIPSKLTRAGMMELLDDHCAGENGRRRRGAVTAAYDFLYLPMDFSMCSRQRSSNKGYAFVNLTTADAAAGLYRALHGCRWDPSLRSDKIIRVDAARIQGKERLARHFSVSTFVCHSDEYLPAVFSPPRHGGPRLASKPRPVGLRVPPPPNIMAGKARVVVK
ncbi:protein MEI2-like 7 [Brachypodium distachyon]|uniref:protein MEI2-like 7 n=1 Tax=Brachypodium distachyon TaxID=15368 RepID=UPI00052FFDCB|nr:protein MEI2-like 7 [Brachypodium distachyon]|eukprot:XP_010236274.1 protein MEI2-like 7 [Brachypodium distachyon]